ncbi:MAG: hypothetical protein KDA65_17115 [Planctomycetaceae bacterium]|nr:hypothetical protein [Planctomycetaceae bacterium]
MKKIIYFTFSVVAIACNQNQRQDLNATGEEVQDFAREFSEDFQKQWNELTISLEEYDKRLDEKLDSLQVAVDAAGDKASNDMRESKKNMEAWSKDIKYKLKIKKEQAAENWDVFKKETKNYLESLDKKLGGGS